ncbi:MAG: hypothetical protein GX957_08535 [Clostridiaceae bacterium]|nr:hypothetical protein [Clostridiaceae bacterium]
MNSLIIYDQTGFIISQKQGTNLREPIGIPFIWVEVPQGKYVTSIDVSGETHVPVFEDLPKSEVQELKEQVADLNIAMASILGGV